MQIFDLNSIHFGFGENSELGVPLRSLQLSNWRSSNQNWRETTAQKAGKFLTVRAIFYFDKICFENEGIWQLIQFTLNVSINLELDFWKYGLGIKTGIKPLDWVLSGYYGLWFKKLNLLYF